MNRIATFLLFVYIQAVLGFTVYDEVIQQKLVLGTSLQQVRSKIATTTPRQSEQLRLSLNQIEKRADNLHLLAHLSDESNDIFPHRVEYQSILSELSGLESKASHVAKRDLSANYSTIFEHFPLTAEFVACTNDTSCTFITELLGSGREYTVADFANLTEFIGLERGWDMNSLDIFLRAMMQLLYQQTKTNPAAFVSHGTDHSVRVMGFASVLSALNEVSEGMNATHYIADPENRRWALMLHGLLHDVGYADLDIHNVPKWLHAQSGFLLVSEALTTLTNNIGRDLLNNISDGANLTEAFLIGIQEHNLDDGQCIAYPNKVSSCMFSVSGDPNDPRSATTPLLNGSSPYYRTFTRASPINRPMTFVIRIADNLDAQYSRLSSWQQDTNLMRYLLSLYTDADTRIAVGDKTLNSTTVEAVRAAARVYWKSQYTLANDSKTLELVDVRANEQSFLHFYSNWIVKSIVFDLDSLSLTVNFRGKADGVPDELLFEKHIGPGLYQINRLAISMNSLDELAGQSVLSTMEILLNGVSTSNLPLAAFTHATAYNTSGPSYPLCQSYCNDLTLNLTQSIEPCVNRNNTIVPCPASFGLISPFSDLYYPDAVNTTTSSSSSMSSSSSSTTSTPASSTTSEVSISSRTNVMGLLVFAVGVISMFI